MALKPISTHESRMRYNMSKRDNDILINDILDGSRKIFRYTERLSFEEFKADEKTVDAVIRNFEIIG